MRISVCIDALFDEWEPGRALEAVSVAGLDAFEFWGWAGRDVAQLDRERRRLGLSVHALCTRKVSLTDPARRADYLQGLKDSLPIAERLGARLLITQVGDEIPGASRDAQRRSIVDGLCACVPALEGAGVTLLVEPLNTAVDHPGYFLSSSQEAFSILADVGSPWVQLLFDIYHQQVTEGNLLESIRAHIHKIGHFHAAGVPGRHELSGGELDYRAIFRAIDGMGYEGRIGFEYFPLRDPVEGLASWAALAKGG
jgi:hydroxypyruvate isomerase